MGKAIAITITSLLVTALFFTVEALLHFNIGKTGHISLRYLPDRKELVRIVSVVLLFSLLSAATTELLTIIFFPDGDGNIGIHDTRNVSPFACPA